MVAVIIIGGIFVGALIVGMVLGHAMRGSDDEGESDGLRML